MISTTYALFAIVGILGIGLVWTIVQVRSKNEPEVSQIDLEKIRSDVLDLYDRFKRFQSRENMRATRNGQKDNSELMEELQALQAAKKTEAQTPDIKAGLRAKARLGSFRRVK